MREQIADAVVAKDEKARETLTLTRLAHLQGWYDTHASQQQNAYIAIRVTSIVIAAGIPAAVALGADESIVAVMGSLVAVLQGIDSAFRFRDHWLLWRATSEQLLHERRLFLSGAGDYENAEEPARMLAMRVEGFAAREFTEMRGIILSAAAPGGGSK